MLLRHRTVKGFIYKPNGKRIQRKDLVSLALLGHSPLPLPNLGHPVVTGERFGLEGPGVGGETQAFWKETAGTVQNKLHPPLRPPRLALGLRLGRQGTGLARRVLSTLAAARW